MLEKFKESLEFRCNFGYIAAQGLYWMIVCCTISMGNAYLSNKGFSTVSIGFLFAFAYLFAALIQQIVSAIIDRSAKSNVMDVLFVLGIILGVDLLIGLGTKESGFITGFSFLVGAMVATIMQPFLNSLNFHIEEYGVKMNFGVARASGSFFFFVMSIVAGNLMKFQSPNVAPCFGFMTTALFVATIVWISIQLKNSRIQIAPKYDPFEATQAKNSFELSEIKSFVTNNKMFFVFLIGVVCFFFGHLLINTFIYDITTTAGGDEADNGGLLAFAALVELPAMIFFSKLKERFKTRDMIIVSAIFFFVKILLTTLANTVGMLYVSMFFQAFAFALFIPASVHYVDEIMDKTDAVKGQSAITVAITISNLISSLLGGMIIGALNVNAALWFATLITLVGVVIAIYGLLHKNKKIKNL